MASINIVEKNEYTFHGARVQLLKAADGSISIDLIELCVSYFPGATAGFDAARLPASVWAEFRNTFSRGRAHRHVLGLAGLPKWLETFNYRVKLQGRYPDKIEVLQKELPQAIDAFLAGEKAWPVIPQECAAQSLILAEDSEPTNTVPARVIPLLLAGCTLECASVGGQHYVSMESLLQPFDKRVTDNKERLDEEGWADIIALEFPDGRKRWCVNKDHVHGVLFGLDAHGMTDQAKSLLRTFKAECAQVLANYFNNGASINTRFSDEQIVKAIQEQIAASNPSSALLSALTEVHKELTALRSEVKLMKRAPENTTGYYTATKVAQMIHLPPNPASPKNIWKAAADLVGEAARAIRIHPDVENLTLAETEALQIYGKYFDPIHEGENTMGDDVTRIKHWRYTAKAIEKIRAYLEATGGIPSDAPPTTYPSNNVIKFRK